MLEPALKQPLTAFRTDVWQTTVSLNDLNGLVAGRKRLARVCLLQIASACQFLHANGVMHRDIKPDNTGVAGLEEPFRFYLLDLGHALAATESDDHFKGTIRYLAPEVLNLKRQTNGSSSRYGNKVDVWALGLVGAELTRALTIRDDTHAMQLAHELSQAGNQDALSRALMEMLQVEPTSRCSMASVVDRLRNGRI